VPIIAIVSNKDDKVNNNNNNEIFKEINNDGEEKRECGKEDNNVNINLF